MKKFLVATSALVAAGSAAALDVTLGGDIEIEGTYTDAASGVAGVTWDVDLTIAASGESMGWTYGGEVELSMTASGDMDVRVHAAEIYFGGDFMGKIAVKDECGDFVKVDGDGFKTTDNVVRVAGNHCVEWTGVDLGVASIDVAASLDETVENLDAEGKVITSGNLIVGGSLDLGVVALDGEYAVDTNMFDAIASTSVGGTGLAVGMTGDNGLDTFEYSLLATTEWAGYGVEIQFSPGYGDKKKDLMVELTQGCFAVDLGMLGDNAAALDMWSIRYDCPLHEGFTLDVTVGDRSSTSDELSALVEATVSF